MKTLKFAVIGHPIGHTMSPFIHQRLFALRGINAQYGVFDISPEELALPRTISKLKELDGFNITIPHKQAIIPLLNCLDEKARAFSSVNTVKRSQGAWTGYTTDGIGFINSMTGAGLTLDGSSLVLGSGGVARVMAFELLNACPHPDLTLCVRQKSLRSAMALKAELLSRTKPGGRISVCSYEELDCAKPYRFIINGTSVGMYPHEEVMPPVDPAIFRKGVTVFDAIYNPENTLLLNTARKAGCLTIGGMDMLVWQAAAAQAIWYGAAFTPAEIRALCAQATLEMNRIFHLQEGKAQG